MANLNAEEVDALMSAISEGREAATASSKTAPEVTRYDLTSRDRIIRGQMPTLDAINEQVASLLGTGLAWRTRLDLKVTASPAALLKLLDFNALLTPPTVVVVLSLGQGHGYALAALEANLCDALLAAALGDRKVRTDDAPPEGRHELTGVERQVLKRLLTTFTDAMGRAWEPVLALKPEVLRFESDPRLAIIAPPNETAILSTFELGGAMGGRLQLAIPFATVDGVKKLLASPPRVNGGLDARFTQALADELEQVEVELSACLGRTELSLERVLDLEVGAVLTLNTEEGVPVPVCVEGRPRLLGHPRIAGGSHAVVLETGLTMPRRAA